MTENTMTKHGEKDWKRDLYVTLESAGRDLEQRGDAARRWMARTLRRIAPGIVHAGAQLGSDLREVARFIDAKLFQEGKPTSTA